MNHDILMEGICNLAAGLQTLCDCFFFVVVVVVVGCYCNLKMVQEPDVV